MTGVISSSQWRVTDMLNWRSVRRVLLASTALVPLGLAPAIANPVGPQVVGGAASVAGVGTSNVTVTQTTDKAIINWHTFNIGTGERTQFIQPGASSIALNRVTGGLGPSQLYGTLTANGRIFLVNPDGVMIGAGAKINTAGFLATTHDIKNEDFMAGRYHFNIPGKPDASIVNHGNITASHHGFAALVAPGVRNTGTITATFGKIGLAAGNGFSLDLYGDKLITLSVSDSIAATVKDVSTGQPLSSLVSNEGTLKANGGRVELTAATARKVVDSVINNSGVIEARSIGHRNGKIVLGGATASTKVAGAPVQTVKVSGTLTVASKKRKGGTVQVTGEHIEVAAATIDASGATGGGKVLIGGDVAGGLVGGTTGQVLAAIPQAKLEGHVLPTASTVSVNAATTIDASAKKKGDGGKVVVWSDEATSFAGTVKATGGAKGGNGGFVEISGKQWLGYTGLVDTRAPYGSWGTLLLDPHNVTIGATTSFGMSGFTAVSDNAILSVTDLLNALATNNVIVSTGTGGSQPGIITVGAPISWGSASTLTLSTPGDINFNSGINATAGGLTLASGGTISTIAAIEVAKFDLLQGNWVQVGTGLPTFTATQDFKITGGSFLRADGGIGTTLFPYLIADVYGLQGIGSGTLLPTRSFQLAGNIDASVTTNWADGFKPIGSMGTPFTGKFDGALQTISNLTIAPTTAVPNPVGLFSVIGTGGIVQDLRLTNVSVIANPNFGAAMQHVGTLAGINMGAVSNVHASGTVDGGTVNDLTAGGLVGSNGNFNGSNVIRGTIDDSSAAVNVTAGGVRVQIGGLVGYNAGSLFDFANSGSIFDSRATGNVTANGTITTGCSFNSGPCDYINAGGLVGFNQGFVIGTASPVVNANPMLGTGTYATGAVHVGSQGVAGGLAGQSDGIIDTALATGAVTGLSGLAGPTQDDHRETTLGGLVGQNRGTITDSEATGNVGSANTNYARVGGLVGHSGGLIGFSQSSGIVAAGDHSQAGGLAGSSEGNNFSCNNCNLGVGFNFAGAIADSSSTSDVTVGSVSLAGGLAGNASIVINSGALGSVTAGDNSVVGGLVGAVELDGVITSASATGAVTAGPNSWVGGLVGANGGIITANSTATGTVTGNGSSVIGGLVAFNIGAIDDSHASGAVVGNGANNVIGGFAGANLGLINDSTASGNVTGAPGNVAGSLVGANIALLNVVPGMLPHSTFPIGTIVNSAGTGTVNGNVGPQVGTTAVASLPVAPLVVGSCDGDALCELLTNPKLKELEEKLPEDLPKDIFANSQIVNSLPQPDKAEQRAEEAKILIALTSPSSNPAPTGSSTGNRSSSAGSQVAGGAKPNLAPPQQPRPIAGPDGERFSSIPPLNETRFFSNEVILQVGSNITPEQIAQVTQRLGLSVISSQTLGSLGRTAFRFQITGGRSVREVIRALEANSIVAVAQPNYQYKLSQTTAAIPPDGGRRGDPSQYMMSKLHLDAVHRMVGGKDIMIAVIDSEIDGDHSELMGVIAQRYATVGENDKPHSHGTAMAGAISARDRLLGVAPSSRILAVRAFSESENSADGTTFNIIRAIDWAVGQGARVINMSFAGPHDPSLARAIKAAHDKGVVMIAAAGNAGPKSPPLFPGADPHVIAVTATDSEDRLFRGANRGPYVSVAAPGVDILAPAPQAAYQLSTGTSIATAHVSGVVALMLERDPTLTPAQVRQILEATAVDLGNKGRDSQFGWGLVDPRKALQAVTLRASSSDATPRPPVQAAPIAPVGTSGSR